MGNTFAASGEPLSFQLIRKNWVERVENTDAETCREEIVRLWNKPSHGQWREWRESVENAFLGINSFEDLDLADNVILKCLWKITCDMLLVGIKSECTQVQNVQTYPPLLSFLIRHQYPLMIVWLAIKLHPDKISQRDHEGRIPLHYSFQRSYVLSHFSKRFSERAVAAFHDRGTYSGFCSICIQEEVWLLIQMESYLYQHIWRTVLLLADKLERTSFN